MIWKCGRRHICTIFVVGIFTCCLNWTIFTLFTTNCTSYRSYWSHYMDIGTLRVFASKFSQVVLIQINRAASECKLTLDTNSYAQIDHNWNTTTYQYYVLAGLLICCAYLVKSQRNTLFQYNTSDREYYRSEATVSSFPTSPGHR